MNENQENPKQQLIKWTRDN